MFDKKPKSPGPAAGASQPQPAQKSQNPATKIDTKKPTGFKNYLEGIGSKKKGLEFALKEHL